MDPADPARAQIIGDFVAGLDREALARRFQEDDGVLVLPQLLPAALVGDMVAEAQALVPDAVRKHVPWVRKAGALPHQVIVARAPAMHALQQSPALLSLFSAVTGVQLALRDATEAHASALYTYTRPGDWMDWHLDECGCVPGDSFSTVVGLIDTSTARLVCETRRDQPGVTPLRQEIRTRPGTLVLLCGARAYHQVTPLQAGETRVTFAFTYIRHGRRPGGLANVRLHLGNSLLYFGVGHLLSRGR